MKLPLALSYARPTVPIKRAGGRTHTSRNARGTRGLNRKRKRTKTIKLRLVLNDFGVYKSITHTTHAVAETEQKKNSYIIITRDLPRARTNIFTAIVLSFRSRLLTARLRSCAVTAAIRTISWRWAPIVVGHM